MGTFAALLRGINVGGKHKVPMPELRSVFAGLGMQNVATYIQSGNIVFRTKATDERRLAARIEKRIAETFALEVSVLLRTAAELEQIADHNPFLQHESDLSKLHVVFLDGEPEVAAADRLDPSRSPPDRFHLRGREIYLHLPNGAGRTKLTIDYFERRLGVRATARNWNTLLKLVSLTAD